MIEAVIFDMDGLIIDSEPIQSKAFEILLKKYGKKPVVNKWGIIHEAGVAEDINCQRVLEQYDINEKLEVFLEKRRKEYVKLLQKKIKPMNGLLPLLKTLEKQKIKTALASSSTKKHVNLILKKLDIEKYFLMRIGREDVKRLKPYPDLYNKALKKLNAKKQKCIALEDSESGVIAGKKADLYVVAIPSIYTKHQNFSQADMIIDSLSEFNELLLKGL